jgi:hypothetical protein
LNHQAYGLTIAAAPLLGKRNFAGTLFRLFRKFSTISSDQDFNLCQTACPGATNDRLAVWQKSLALETIEVVLWLRGQFTQKPGGTSVS